MQTIKRMCKHIRKIILYTYTCNILYVCNYISAYLPISICRICTYIRMHILIYF